MITKQQYRKLMTWEPDLECDESRDEPALRVSIWQRIKTPDQLQAKHMWRTREDPLWGFGHKPAAC